jgi:hypothetical protein
MQPGTRGSYPRRSISPSLALALVGIVLIPVALFVPWFQFRSDVSSSDWAGGWLWVTDWGLWTGQTDCYDPVFHNQCAWQLTSGDYAILVAGMLLCLVSLAAFVEICIKRRQWYWLLGLALLGLPVFAGWRGSLCLQWGILRNIAMACWITEIKPTGPALLLLAAILEASALFLVFRVQHREAMQ